MSAAVLIECSPRQAGKPWCCRFTCFACGLRESFTGPHPQTNHGQALAALAAHREECRVRA